jgi:hypothetical protein
MVLHTQVALSYQDYERVSAEILRGGRLSLRATVISETGGRNELPELLVPSERDLKHELREDWDENDVAIRMERYVAGLSCHQFRTQGVHSFKYMVSHHEQCYNLYH